MKTPIKVSHEQIALKGNFETFTQNIEVILNRLNPDWSIRLLDDPEAVRKYLIEVAGDTGLMIFGQQEHGKLLNIKGKPRKAIQYLIGNPLTAVEMTQYDVRAALYAPLRILVYEGDDSILYAEYDLPSTLFGQFENSDILKIAKKLDESILKVILAAGKNN